jgi:predicted MFS family arabinose efflux permease
MRLSQTMSFWYAAAVLGTVFASSAVLSPLYRVYQERWHFSPVSLTAVFAVYAIAVLAVLLIGGSLSDHVGRRPVMALALVSEVVSAWLFLSAHGLGALYAGRILQGVATGAAASAAGAALIDLQPNDRPTAASTMNAIASSAFLAVGALGAGLLVQYAPAPTHLVFWVLLAVSAACLAVLVLMDEPGVRRPVSLGVLRPRAGIPPAARAAFVAALPALIATWALGGLYFSLAPSLAEQLARSNDVVWGGLVIFLLCAPSAVASLVARGAHPSQAMVVGSWILAAGSAATVVAVLGRSSTGLLVSTVVAGVGFGAAFLGAFRHLVSLATDDQRGALVATIYIVSYLAFSLPVIGAGVATDHFGLRSTSVAYGAAVAAFAALAAVAERVQLRISGRVST